jgi:phosphate:Na+ symporter
MTTLMFFTLLGEIGLLLYGIKIAGEGLQKAAGARIREILSSLTRNRLVAVLVGAMITVLLQSSSATSVMLIGFVSSGLMSLPQTIGVILGADIGTTVTVQILSMNIYDYAIVVIGVGVAMMFHGRAEVKNVGQGILGFAFIFMAIGLISSTVSPLKENELFRTLLLSLQESPFLILLLSTIFTSLVHSSAATIGIALAFSLQGLITLSGAIPIIFGANIGTCTTALISSIGATVEARQVAAAHILFKILGVAIFYPFMDQLADVVARSASDLPRQIANAHTFFNIGITVIFLPLAGPMARLIQWMVPEMAEEARFAPKYLDERVLSSPSLALGQAARESLRMADIVQEMFRESIEAFRRDDVKLVERLEERDNDVDLLDREIKLYLTRLIQESMEEGQSKRQIQILSFINDMENIGDIIDKNLMELAKKKVGKGLSFSGEGLNDICELHQKVSENFDLAISAFASGDLELARRLIARKAVIGEMERELKQAHIQRLQLGLRESIDTSAIHLDVLTNLKRINSHICNITYTMLAAA